MDLKRDWLWLTPFKEMFLSAGLTSTPPCWLVSSVLRLSFLCLITRWCRERQELGPWWSFPEVCLSSRLIATWQSSVLFHTGFTLTFRAAIQSAGRSAAAQDVISCGYNPRACSYQTSKWGEKKQPAGHRKLTATRISTLYSRAEKQKSISESTERWDLRKWTGNPPE